MKATLIKIGNSQGVRLPKSVIAQCGFKREIAMSVENGAVVLRAKRKPREGWDADAARCAAAGDDALLLGDFPNAFDEKEWTW